jgi:N-acetylneuraminate synthase
MIRSIVHEVKGMLNEAKIVIGNTLKIELSHQYGLEHFRQTGAVLIDVVNRLYCKKLIIILPGQSHPTHYHRVKEETFQLLSGDLKVVTGETIKTLNPGDIFLVEPSTPHSFSSMTGAIFEEVSTTHIIGDSIYEDESINKQDPMERKTIIENW